ncbi:MAG TPA: YaiO family outer membrane beta-barrel protein [Roseivirga sp.]
MKGLFICLLLLTFGVLKAQDSSLAVRFNSSIERVSNSSNWQEHGLAVGFVKPKQFEVLAKSSFVQRFGNQKMQYGIGGFAMLHSSVYVTSEMSFSEGGFLPKYAFASEVFKVIEKSEFSLGYRLLAFDENIHLLSVGFSQYWLSELTTLKVYHAKPSFTDNNLWSFIFRNRHYFNEQTYMEFGFGFGEEVSRNTESFAITNIANRNISLGLAKSWDDLTLKLSYTLVKEEFNNNSRTRNAINLSINWR